jgi:CRP-like cAMP-binding protein
MSEGNFKIDFKECKDFLEPYFQFNTLEWKIFQSKIKVKKYKANEIIHYAGDVSKEFVILKKGIMRGYMVNDLGRDFTWHFYFNNEKASLVDRFAVDYDSFINQTPSRLSIEVTEECEAYVISYKDMMEIYSTLKHGKTFAKKVAESFSTYTHNRYINRIMMDAQERLEEFMENVPFLFEKVYQSHIATYLGITPQSLCRLKKELNL